MTTETRAEINQRLGAIAETLGIPQIERHLFLCADATVPKCGDRETSLAVWEHLKRRLKELEPATPSVSHPKANCLRVCAAGPILAIYPDRVWYHSVTVEALERILQEHLLENRIVADLAFVTPPPCLPSPEKHDHQADRPGNGC
ncbi:MAG: ferredoxin [Oscillatoriales cyanobacterium SM2_1_8]|nr:ferredoxin [Oscillatoriales cyanobacterium SM2_1_8]